LDAIRELKTSGYKILVIEQTDLGLPVQQFEPGENLKFALVFGNEINGVDEEILAYADSCLDIPQFGTKHSLNVSVVIGIILWEVLRKIKKI
jgi:tRNA G18 (ribose-2'-O)-methylase SpoU